MYVLVARCIIWNNLGAKPYLKEGKILINYGLPLRLLIVKKVLWIIIGVLIGTVGTIVGIYVYTTQELIEAQINIDRKEECNSQLESLKQRARDFLNSGESREAVSNEFKPEIDLFEGNCKDILNLNESVVILS